MVDVHKMRAYTIAREAAQTAQFAEQIARLGQRLTNEGDEEGARLNAILAYNLHSQVAGQLQQIRALRAEVDPEDEDETEGSDVEIPGPWTL